ncbi:MAG: 50S ribosomal protein L22 [Phycisphaerales bacterium]
MRIHGANLSQVAQSKGISAEQLAESIVRTGLPKSRSLSAVKNWMKGRDHPRCRASDITKMAEVLGVAPADIARFTCILKYHRGSPRKANLLAQLIRGKDIITAENLLTFTTKRAALDVKKALVNARTDAEQANADLDKLFVSESRVDEGPMMKRFQPKDRGRAHRILKRQTHITVSVEQRA